MKAKSASKPPSTRKRRGVVARLALLLCVPLFMLALTEGVCWAVDFEYTPLEIKLQGKSDYRIQHVFKDEHFVYDSELIWAPRSGFGIFNDDGYRGEKLPMPKPKGEFRVIAIGDSNTLGWNSKNGPNWPLYYGDILTAAGIENRTANAGVWGYTSYQGIRRLEQMLKLDPDLVFFSFGSNDCQYTVRSDEEFADSPVRQGSLDTWLMKSRVGQLVVRAMDASGGTKPGEGRCRVPKPDYRANLKKAITMCRERDVDLVLLTRPFLPHPEEKDPYHWSNVTPEYRVIDLEVAKETGNTLVDFKSRFEDNAPNGSIFMDDSHFSEFGHRTAAAYLYEKTKHLLPK